MNPQYTKAVCYNYTAVIIIYNKSFEQTRELNTNRKKYRPLLVLQDL